MCVLLNYLDHPPFCIGKQRIIKLLPLAEFLQSHGHMIAGSTKEHISLA